MKNGKHPRVKRPNMFLMKQAVIRLILMTEKQVAAPVKTRRVIEPEV